MADDGDLVQWLSHGVALPADLHPESYSFLRRLAEASARRDAAERQVALAAQGRAAEHAAELEEVEDTLQQCGLTPSSLPTAVSSSLDTLASSAAALGLRDTSLCSLYNALDALEMEEAEMKSAVEGDKALCASLRCRLSDCEGLVQLLHNTERECRSKAEREGEEQAGRLNDMATLEKKSVQYKEDVLRLKQELKRNGVSDKIYHSKILQESEAVKGVHAELEPLRAAVKSFHGLPADLALAKQQVKEARGRLENIEAQLELSIRDMVVGAP